MAFSKTMACVALVAAPLVWAEPTSRDWQGEAELGVLITSGNSDQSKINSRLGVRHEVDTWRNTAEFRSLYSDAEGTTSAERYGLTAETNYKFTEQQYAFVRGAYDDDRFSGYDFQSSVTSGYGARVWEAGERSFLDLSVGAGYRFIQLEVADENGSRNEEQAIGRLAGQFDYALSDTALFRQQLSTEVGLSDNNAISESETAIQATIAGNLSMKAAYRVKHVSDAPVDVEKTDTATTLSLLYGF